MEAIITAATVMAMYLNATTNPGSQNFYNADVEGGQVKTMYVFDNGECGLSKKAEYRYTYDRMGRVSTKTVMQRDAATGRMKPKARLTFRYTAGGYDVEHSAWNSLTQCFEAPDSRTDYRMEGSYAMSVTNYRLNGGNGEMLMTDNFIVMQPYNDMLLAEENKVN